MLPAWETSSGATVGAGGGIIVGPRRLLSVIQWHLVCAPTKPFFTLYSSRMENFSIFLLFLTIQNDKICYVKHVLDPLYVFFTIFGFFYWGGGQVGQEWVRTRGTQERQRTGGGGGNTTTQNAAATPGGTSTSRRGAARQGRQPGQREQGTGTWEVGEHAHGGQRQHRGWPGQPAPSLPVLGQPLINRHQVGVVSRSPEWAVCAKGGGAHQGQTSREGERDDKGPPAHTPHQRPQLTQGRPGPPPPSVVPPARPSLPLHHHCAQQQHWPSMRPIDPTGGLAVRSDAHWASRGSEELRKMPSARRGWGTQRAPAVQFLCPSTLRGTCTQWATTGAPDVFHAATSARRGSGTQGTNLGAAAAQRRCSFAPRGSCAQWATVGARAEQGWLSRTRKHREAGCGRPEDGGVWTAKAVKRPPQQPTHPQYFTYWAPLTRTRHTMPHPAQPQHTNH